MARWLRALLLCLALVRPAYAEPGPASDWLIRLSAGETAERFVAAVRADPSLSVLLRDLEPLALKRWLRIRFDAAIDEQTLTRILQDIGGFDLLEPNRRWRLVTTLPDDTDFAQQWGLRNTGQVIDYPQDPADGYSTACDSQPDDGIDWCDLDPVSDTARASMFDIEADQAWDVITGAGTLRIGIVDSGIDPQHPDLADRIWRPSAGELTDPVFSAAVYGWDACDGDGEPEDLVGHGTQVAAIAAAAGNDDTGVSGVAWDGRIVVARALGPERFDGSGCNLTSSAIEALEFVRQAGVDVVNLSWGGPEPSQALLEKLQQLVADGIVIVAAAGNDGRNIDSEPFYPASWAIPGMIVVTAHTNDGRLASFANTGQKVDVAAPGVAIRTALPGRTDVWNERNFNGFSGQVGRLSPGPVAGTDFYGDSNRWAIGTTLTGDRLVIGDYDAAIRNPPEAHTGPWTQTLTSQPFDALTFGSAVLFIELYHDLGPGSSVRLQYSTNSASASDALATWNDLPGDVGRFEGYGIVERFIDLGTLWSTLPSSLSIRFVMTTVGNWSGSESVVQGGLQIASVRWWRPSTDYSGGRGYTLAQGTSMAAPFATGVAALLRARQPALNPDAVVSALSLRSRTLPLMSDALRISGGHMLDAARALDDSPLLVWLGEAPFEVSGAVPNPVEAGVPVSFAARILGDAGPPDSLRAALAWRMGSSAAETSFLPATVDAQGRITAAARFEQAGIVEWRFAVTLPVSGFELAGDPADWQPLMVVTSSTETVTGGTGILEPLDRRGCGCHAGPGGAIDWMIWLVPLTLWVWTRRVRR